MDKETAMTIPNFSKFKSAGKLPFTLLFLAAFLFPFAEALFAQGSQLSLADLVVGLRSKKVTLPERNKILTDAVKQRGITFALTQDIEKELATTGADTNLLTAIRTKSPAPKVEPPKPVAAATPVPTPTPPDFSFYQKRADENAGKGDFANALADYGKAAEMRSTEPSIFLGRGRTHFSMKQYELSIADFDKAISLAPKSSVAYYNRGAAYEKLGNSEKAMTDFQASVDLDAANEAARNALKRLKDEAEAVAAAKIKAAEAAKPPAFVAMGTLSAANATRMAAPAYSQIAQRANIAGKVVVEVEVDEEGSVVSAKAVSGPQMLRSAAEEAASRSKFKPAMFAGKPNKGKGTVVYNFSLRPNGR